MGPEDRAKSWGHGPHWSCRTAGGSPAQGHHGPHSLCGYILGQDTGSALSWGGRDHTDGQILGQLRPLAEEEEGAGAVAVPSARPAFPGMGSEELQLASFYDWPLTAMVRPELLAAAGFFHTGQQDKMRCFFCHGSLQSWEQGDDPWTEHAKWFPRCEFLLQTKGRDFVCSVQESCCNQVGSWILLVWPQPTSPISPVQRVEVRVWDGVTSPLPVEDQVKPRPRGGRGVLEPPGAQSVEEQLQRLQEQQTCKVCLDRAVSIVFVPCGHLVCAECAPVLQLCPSAGPTSAAACAPSCARPGEPTFPARAV
ncbi:hypothetical protein HPG69_012478 [Diceros bicornis minor]|uniref:RING-type E3 ubiquitin transferase n=1 Tax=Diceros bicornis minor TaxID=77932 RepID=A0A7J7EFC2_DICBM|nr:hypothetical protein HPG69_012478 [Diceros bicornis minor]